ncbi:MAG: hypothetical protein IT371_06235 [Deltaproteobacteria bacterium]|nr:hypothetical protein [Deltaproteobacteria bacterium]
MTSHRMAPARFAAPVTTLLLLASACDGGSRAVHPADPCLTCHAENRKRAFFPNHGASDFPTTCLDCHTQEAWKPAKFAHADLPLVGRHGKLECKACHATKPVPIACAGCHEKDRARPKDPSHLAAGFPTLCETCHFPTGWKPAVDHRKFPLTGRHSGVACADCHQPPAPTPAQCVGCHEKDRARPKTPNHLQDGFPTLCENCHLAAGWSYSRNNHTAKFPLTGGHAPRTCLDCHARVPVPKTCVGCHDADRTRGIDPDHRAPGFSTACETCHGTTAWLPAKKP